MILWDEIARVGGGSIMGQMSINSMALPPIINYGTEEMKDEVVRAVVRGDKNICLAISEPTAGSDVARIQTTAVLEGDTYVVNGTKKWITGGLLADWFTMAVRTSGHGMGGLSLLLVPRHTRGITIR